MEISTITYQENVQKPTISRKIDAYRFLGLTRPNAGTLSGEGFNNKQCSYSEMLIDRLKPEIRSSHRGQLSKGIVLLHDNAHPHTAVDTVETLQKLMFVALANPPYSPDLARSDYHLFGPLKETLRGC